MDSDHVQSHCRRTTVSSRGMSWPSLLCSSLGPYPRQLAGHIIKGIRDDSVQAEVGAVEKALCWVPAHAVRVRLGLPAAVAVLAAAAVVPAAPRLLERVGHHAHRRAGRTPDDWHDRHPWIRSCGAVRHAQPSAARMHSDVTWAMVCARPGTANDDRITAAADPHRHHTLRFGSDEQGVGVGRAQREAHGHRSRAII